ncbi:hypothetical protein LV780_04695 [Cereibacter azotoformans]|uniref:hypothetical protein n=1 Tax=Cereibacter azotoformans TaxID=43057 RepID=UPI000E35CEAE|nr:hypothetical protein [Cereibacter azotoformans]AXQ93170.1 hypothetical protein D0Z66_04695 [Cereibacter sphaeroides]UIJ31479.1 hypothetical protein LV780_04695 [Cereibacter azotoformans]
MNLRILKKLSKRAAPYLPLLGDTREQFQARSDDDYHGTLITDRKHFQRLGSIHSDPMPWLQREIITEPRCRAGTRWPFLRIYPPHHPWSGTIMVGAMSGGYEPEWDETDAWDALDDLVRCHFTDWEAMAAADDAEDRGEERPKRKSYLTETIRGPADIFRLADRMIAEVQHG